MPRRTADDLSSGFIRRSRVAHYPNGERLAMSCGKETANSLETLLARRKNPPRAPCKGYTPAVERRLETAIWASELLPDHRLFGAHWSCREHLDKRRIRRIREKAYSALRRWLFGSEWLARIPDPERPGRTRFEHLLPCIFVKEWQERGALHLHLVFQIPMWCYGPGCSDLARVMATPHAFNRAWVDACAAAGVSASHFGQSAEWARCDNAVLGYLMKHLRKGAKKADGGSAEQRIRGDAAEGAGKVWGKLGGWPQVAPVMSYMSRPEATARRRLQRKLRFSRARADLKTAAAAAEKYRSDDAMRSLRRARRSFVAARNSGKLRGKSLLTFGGERAPPIILAARSASRGFSLGFVDYNARLRLDDAARSMVSSGKSFAAMLDHLERAFPAGSGSGAVRVYSAGSAVAAF